MREYRQTHTTTYSFADAAAGTFFISIAALLCFYSALWMAQDIFPDWQISAAAKIWLNALVIFTAAFYEILVKALPDRRQQLLCRLLLPLAYGIIIRRFVKQVQIDFEDGACAFGVQFVEKYNKHLHASVSMWEGREEFLGMSLSVCLISIALALLILALLSGRRMFLLLLPGVVLAAELLIGYTPNWQGVACFFAGAVLLYSGEWDARLIALRIHRSGRIHKSAGQQLRRQACTASIFLMALAVGGAVLRKPAERLMEKTPQVRQFQKETEQKIASLSSGLFMSRQENVNNHTPHYTGAEVMKITASQKPVSDLYLRGFCGTDYENGQWVCRSQAFADACSQAGLQPQEAGRHLLQKGHDALAIGFDRFAAMVSDTFWMGSDGGSYTIDYEMAYNGLYQKNAYLPYFIDLEASLDKVQISGDISLEKERRQDKITVCGWNHTVDQITAAFAEYGDSENDEVFQWYTEYVDHAYLAASARVPAVQDFLGDLSFYEYGYLDPNVISQDAGMLRENIRNWMEMQDDTAYRNCIRLELAAAVSSMLKSRLSYQLNLEPLPEGADAVEYFLSESHKGYCVHFASAAALMMRELGIPARYVSGYVVRSEKFLEQDGQYVASVKDRNAHAWIEIYLEGIGWVPVDVTPGDAQSAASGGDSSQMSGGSGQEQQTDIDTDTQTDTDTQADETDAKEDQQPDTHLDDRHPQGGINGGGAGKAVFLVHTALSLAGILLVVLLLIWTVRKIARQYQTVLRQELKSGQYRKAVKRINHRLYRKLHMRRKLHGRDITDSEYGQALEAAYGEVSKADWEQYMGILKEAVFSGRELQKDDAYFCYQLYRRLCGKKKRGGGIRI